MRLLAILGLCVAFVAVASAGDGDSRYCENCISIGGAITTTPAYQVVEGSTVGTPNEDFAYSFVAIAGGAYRFTFCEGGGWANFDTAMSVQGPDTCGPYVECNDDFCGLQSQVDFYATMDATYIAVVDGWSSNTGNYGLAYRGPEAPTPADNPSWGEIKAMYR